MNGYLRRWIPGWLVVFFALSGIGRAEAELFAFENGLGFGTFAEEAAFLRGEGYAGVSQVAGDPERVARQAEAYRKEGLRVLSVYLDAGAPELTEGRADDLMAGLAGKVETIELTVKKKGPGTMEDVRRISEAAENNGLEVALYPHHGYAVATTADAMEIVRKLDRPNLGMMFNLCHFLRAGKPDDLAEVLEGAKGKLLAASVSGADAAGKEWDSLIRPLDQGNFDQGKLLTELKKIGFRGPFALQCYGIKGDKRANLRRSGAAWTRLVGAAE